jgi:hypothetical protein
VLQSPGLRQWPSGRDQRYPPSPFGFHQWPLATQNRLEHQGSVLGIDSNLSYLIQIQGSSRLDPTSITNGTMPHHALEVSDIQILVLKCLESREQARLARVSRMFTELCLDALYWELESLINIFSILAPLEFIGDFACKHVLVCSAVIFGSTCSRTILCRASLGTLRRRTG